MLVCWLVYSNLLFDDVEISMISKFKEVCGFEYISKLQCMFQDMQIFKDLNIGFKGYVQVSIEGKNLDFIYLVLGIGFWFLIVLGINFNLLEEIV